VIRVLIVDDDFVVAKVHAGFVAKTPGFEVVGTAHTGADALQAAAELAPDLVLLDIYLPDMTGVSVLQRLRSEDLPDVDVFVVSAARDVDTLRKALPGGVVHYLVKPFDYDTLRKRLEDYAARRQDLAALASPVQADVDRMFGLTSAVPADPRAAMPKGLTPQTAQLVRDALAKCCEDLSAAECAELTGLSRVSARRYLEHLVSAGEASVRLRYGSAGRPERRYHRRMGI
jgi:response regulator of citrate/malate metabolism